MGAGEVTQRSQHSESSSMSDPPRWLCACLHTGLVLGARSQAMVFMRDERT